MPRERDTPMEQVWQGIAKSHDNDELTFIVSTSNEPELYVETEAGAGAARLGKGAYLFNGKQYEADDPNAP